MNPAPPMFCNVLSLLLPLAGYAFAKYTTQHASHGGNLGGAIGIGIAYLAILLLATCLGALAAIVALFRGERYTLLSVLGLLANLGLALKTLAPLFSK